MEPFWSDGQQLNSSSIEQDVISFSRVFVQVFIEVSSSGPINSRDAFKSLGAIFQAIFNGSTLNPGWHFA